MCTVKAGESKQYRERFLAAREARMTKQVEESNNRKTKKDGRSKSAAAAGGSPKGGNNSRDTQQQGVQSMNSNGNGDVHAVERMETEQLPASERGRTTVGASDANVRASSADGGSGRPSKRWSVMKKAEKRASVTKKDDEESDDDDVGDEDRIQTRFQAFFPATEKGQFLGNLANTFSFPVAIDEIVLCEGVVDLFQSMIFTRFQVRAYCKTFNGLLFLIVPMILYYTSARYLPGYVNPLGDEDNERKLFIVSCFYLS